jgi:hypothetical protein
LLDVDPEEISTPDDVALEVCVGSEVADPLLAVLLPAEAEVDDDSGPDDADPSDAGSAHAAPCPANTAAPTPRATASPPTRPMYLEAPIASSCYRQLRVQRAKQCGRQILDRCCNAH